MSDIDKFADFGLPEGDQICLQRILKKGVLTDPNTRSLLRIQYGVAKCEVCWGSRFVEESPVYIVETIE